MGFNAAVEAYRKSAHESVDLGIQEVVGSLQVPFIGGIVPHLKQIGNETVRPFIVIDAFFTGNDSHKKETPEDIEDIKDRLYADELLRLQEYNRMFANQLSLNTDQKINRVNMLGPPTVFLNQAANTVDTGELVHGSQAMVWHNASDVRGNLPQQSLPMGVKRRATSKML